MRRLALPLVASVTLAACSSSSSDPAPAAPSYADPFTIQAMKGERLGAYNSTFEHKGQLFADVDWKAAPFADVKLEVDLESPCYPFTKWKADPPPANQNWPADCDAFDRNFSIYLDDAPPPSDAGVDAGADAAPPPAPFEVAHAITPFGGPEHLEVDLTDLANALPGEHRLRVDISSWADGAGQVSGSNGSWIVSAKLDVTPGPAPRKVLAAVPVIVANLGSDATLPATASFVAPAGTTHGRLEYRTSGHGGGSGDSQCIGPAEEFCHRTQTVKVDGAAVPEFDPWREDCADLCTETPTPSGSQTYCLENPCGATQSVQAPRANWCPGSMTPPFAWTDADAPALGAPGAHTATFDVSKIAGGGSWLVSATYYAYGD